MHGKVCVGGVVSISGFQRGPEAAKGPRRRIKMCQGGVQDARVRTAGGVTSAAATTHAAHLLSLVDLWACTHAVQL